MMKEVLNLFKWLASGIIEGICPEGSLPDMIAEEIKRYNESAAKIGENMQKAWEESLHTLEAALGGGGWITPKSRKQFAERFVKEVITPFAVKNNLTGTKLEWFMKKCLEQCQELIKMGPELIDFKVFDEKVLLDSLSQSEGVNSEDIGIFVIDRIQTQLPNAGELLQLLWHRNLLVEGLAAHFNFIISRNRSLSDVVARMDRRRIQDELQEIKKRLQEALKKNDLTEVAKLGPRAARLTSADELYELQSNYQNIFGSLFEKVEQLGQDHVEIKDKLDQVLGMLAQLEKMQKSRLQDSRIRPEIGIEKPTVGEVSLMEEVHTLVKKIGWNMLPENQQAFAANSLAIGFYRSQKISQALLILEEVIKNGVHTPEIYFNYFEVLQAAGKNRDAVDAYLKAVKLDPKLALFPPDKYEMKEIIGRGGMGVVYKAHWIERDIPVAVKVLLLPEEWYPGARNRFLQSAQAAGGLNHPNIVLIYDVYSSPDSQHPCYIVMEYLEGIDLQHKVKDQGVYGLEEGIDLSINIAYGLAYAHNAGIVHRDLKPGNIMLTRRGPKIIDFGLAKREKDSTLTLAGETFYTLYYSSPEQRANFHSADRRSDIYSFGKTIYYLFTGEEPYDIDWNDIPSVLRPVLQKATRKKPENRYKNMEEIIEDLSRALKGEQLSSNGFDLSESDYFPVIQIEEPPAAKPPQDVIDKLKECVVQEKGTIISGKDEAPMVYVPAGTFLMGDESDRADYDEGPVHEVYLNAYLIDVYPVTNKRYRMFLKDLDQFEKCPAPWCHPDEPKNKVHIPQFWYNSQWNQENHPVVGIDWWDAYAYCKWAGKELPSEAEWEKASRGVDGRIYPWGNEMPTAEICNFNNIYKMTTPVDKFPGNKSPYGCCDMAGNVWEWCLDWFDPTFYKQSPKENPVASPPARCRVGRGGSWMNDARRIRATTRACGTSPSDRNHHLGFRTMKRLY